MVEGNCIISARKPKSRLVIHRFLKCMDVQTVVIVNTNPNASINIMLKRMLKKNRVMKINVQWERLKEKSHANVQNNKRILNRQIRSIQREGHFGDIKENDSFRRFNCQTSEKIYKEFMLYVIERNIKITVFFV